MKFVAILLTVVLMCLESTKSCDTPLEVQLFLLRERVLILSNILYEKCPDLITGGANFRNEATYSLTIDQEIEIEQKLFDHVSALMTECNQRSIPPLPDQCTSSLTVNLNESWRNNWSGETLRNNDTGYLIPGVTWFRFSGPAGNLLKSTCPHVNSCGSTSGAYWSNSTLPTKVGETVNITFYESLSTTPPFGDCDNNRGAQVGRATRCSADRGGVVYILDIALDTGVDTMCGMD